VIIRNARRLKDLTDNILDISRIESQSINLNKEAADIDSLIFDAVQDTIETQTNLINQDVKLLYNPVRKQDGNDEIILVYADKGRIIQVISNILSNALNFTKKGVISIAKEKKIEDASVIVSVTDTGSGIDPQILSKLFTKFTTRSKKGTGGGLSKRIGGKIWGEIMMINELPFHLAYQPPPTNAASR
jgi:signal transduction histidine kinase